jgi:uncharacterized membrane protein (DUF4010 family)
MSDQTILLRLLIAALGGLAVGVERQWSAPRDGPETRFGGVRTFLLLGVLGGLAGVSGESWAGRLLLAGGIALVAVAYFITAGRGAIDATTEVAGVVTLGAGALAGAGELVIASAVFAGTALVLVEKSRMHRAVERIRSTELEAAMRFAVLALVVLPLLPEGPYGPGVGIEPRKLWTLVLLFAGLSFAGYLALRIAGPERGLGVTGLLGGLVSSTAVTLNFARDSRRHEALARPLALGVLAASAVLPVRVALLAAVVHPPVAIALVPALAPAALLGAAFVGFAWWRARSASGEEPPEPPANPLRLGPAIQMALLFQFVLFALAFVRERYGEAGVLSGAALVGLTDLDALTFSVARLAEGGGLETAARALLVGLLANTAFKGAVAAILGGVRFRRIAGLGYLGYLAAYAAGWPLLP